MKQYKINTYAPCFTGFYGSVFAMEHLIEQELEYYANEYPSILEQVIDDNFITDYEGYKNCTAQGYCDGLVSNGSCVLDEYITTCNFQSVCSPRYYNYETDSINCEMVLSEENQRNIQNFIHDNASEFREYLKENYSSRSGFLSFMPNTFEEWVTLTDNFLFDGEMEKHKENYEHTLGAVLEFIVKETEDDTGDFEASMYEEVNTYESISEYYYPNEELSKLIEGETDK